MLSHVERLRPTLEAIQNRLASLKFLLPIYWETMLMQAAVNALRRA